MKQSIHISIPTPCHESWDSMDATARGAFCHSCQKEVVDFSAMTDREVIEYLSRQKVGCGRFRKDQTESPLILSAAEDRRFKWRLLFLIFSQLLFLKSTKAVPIEYSYSQSTAVTSDTIDLKPLQTANSICIAGKVLDVTGEGFSGVNIILENHRSPKQQIGTTTDINGNFSLTIDKSAVQSNSSRLTFLFIGYREKSVSISNLPEQYYTIRFAAEDEVVLGGMEPVIIRTHRSTAQKFKNWFHRTFHKKPKEQQHVMGRL